MADFGRNMAVVFPLILLQDGDRQTGEISANNRL